MKFDIDMSLVTENNYVLGSFEGEIEFNNIPTVGEKNVLFDDNLQKLEPKLENYLQQSQYLEHLTLYDKPNNQDIVGKAFFSFFYIPSISLKDTFVKYFDENYDFYFFDYNDLRTRSCIKDKFELLYNNEVAYLNINKKNERKFAKTVSLSDILDYDNNELDIYIDIDQNNQILGIELLINNEND